MQWLPLDALAELPESEALELRAALALASEPTEPRDGDSDKLAERGSCSSQSPEDLEWIAASGHQLPLQGRIVAFLSLRSELGLGVWGLAEATQARRCHRATGWQLAAMCARCMLCYILADVGPRSSGTEFVRSVSSLADRFEVFRKSVAVFLQKARLAPCYHECTLRCLKGLCIYPQIRQTFAT